MERSPSESKRLAALVRCAVALAVVAGLTGVAGCSSGGSNETVQVPDLIGLTPDAAVGRMCDAGLVPGGVKAAETGARPQGTTRNRQAPLTVTVTASSPAAGTRVEAGSKVSITFRTSTRASVVIAVPVVCELVEG
ncbi:MAG: hypothetical protein AB7O78_03175 [Thermoleophilia bacterium]